MPDIKIIQAAKKNSILLADYMVDNAKISGKYFAYSEQEKMLYVYNGQIYEPFEGIDLDRFFLDFMVQYEITDAWKSSRLAEIERAMTVNRAIPRVKMDDYEYKICFKNGILDMTDMSFVPHSQDYYFTTFVDIDYDPEVGAEPQFFLQVLGQIFWRAKTKDSKACMDAEMVQMIKRIGGSLIFPKNKLRQLFLFLGEGANGKSVVINTFTMFFPKENVTYLTLEELSQKTAERSRLLISRINVTTEAKGNAIDSEEIKKIVYGEGVTIKRKYQEAVEFTPKTKVFVASNTRPYFNDTSHGLSRRLTVVSFNNRFVKKSDYSKYMDPENSGVFLAEDDDVLMAKIAAEKTKILNWFLIGLKELMDNNWDLPESLNAFEAKADYLEGNDTAGTWLKETFEHDENATPLPVIDILMMYRQWYHDNVSPRPLNFAVTTMGTKIREIFRIKPEQYIRGGSRLSAYKLVKKYVSITGDQALDREIQGSTGDGYGDEVKLPNF